MANRNKNKLNEKQENEKNEIKDEKKEIEEKQEKIEVAQEEKKEKVEEAKKQEKDSKKPKKENLEKQAKKEDEQKENDKKEKEKEQNISKKRKQEKKDGKHKKKKKETKKELVKSKQKEIEEAVGKELKSKKKLPAEELKKINKRLFQNIFLAIVIMFYLDFIILGFVNIENSVFVTDLKVFGMALLVVSIGIFEYAYKKDSGKHIIHGIEILLLAFVTILLIYVNLMWSNKFIYITAFVSYVFAIYYVAKSIIIYKKMKKEYFLEEMKKIIKK